MPRRNEESSLGSWPRSKTQTLERVTERNAVWQLEWTKLPRSCRPNEVCSWIASANIKCFSEIGNLSVVIGGSRFEKRSSRELSEKRVGVQGSSQRPGPKSKTPVEGPPRALAPPGVAPPTCDSGWAVSLQTPWAMDAGMANSSFRPILISMIDSISLFTSFVSLYFSPP